LVGWYWQAKTEVLGDVFEFLNYTWKVSSYLTGNTAGPLKRPVTWCCSGE
jgi:hypothetical protein